MEALAKAVVGLLTRGGWLAGLIVLETLMLTGFWFSGPTPFGDAFDRRAAEADLLLMTLTSLPALFAGALLSSGDREDGMADFYRSCRITPWKQVAGTGLGLFAVTGGAMALSLVLSLAVVSPILLKTSSPWFSMGFGLLSTGIHAAWGLALGSWVRSRWAAIAGVLLFWIVSVFALEALVTAVLAVLPARWTFSVLAGFLIIDPSEFVRVTSVFFRGQGWAYGPAFAPVREGLATPLGVILVALVSLAHLALPTVLTVFGWGRKSS
jgi:Cu-processing system permease protein